MSDTVVRAPRVAEKLLIIAGALDTPTALMGRDSETQIEEYARRCNYAIRELDKLALALGTDAGLLRWGRGRHAGQSPEGVDDV